MTLSKTNAKQLSQLSGKLSPAEIKRRVAKSDKKLKEAKAKAKKEKEQKRKKMLAAKKKADAAKKKKTTKSSNGTINN